MDLDEVARVDLGRKLQRECHSQRITQKILADRAGYDEKTIRNIFRGIRVRPGCLEDVCAVLKVNISQVRPVHRSNEHGGYSKTQIEEHLGIFLSYRRSFSIPENILRSVFEFSWNEERECLEFRELQEYVSSETRTSINFSQSGDVYMSASVGLLHLLTKHNGALRLITLTRLRLNDLTMRGSVLTQAQDEFFYRPSVSPIVMQRCNPQIDLETLSKQIGPVRCGDGEYSRLNKALLDVEERLANFATAAKLKPSEPQIEGQVGSHRQGRKV